MGLQQDARRTGGPAEGLLLSTKMDPPATRSGLVRRPHVVELLRTGLPCGLTLVCAPPGWGKTTALAEWGAGPGDLSFAWLALDTGDDNPAGFWRYVAEALRTANPQLGAPTPSWPSGAGEEPPQRLLAKLINQLAAASKPMVLVLQDYHAIRNPEIHDGMSFLVEHLPAQLHVVVASRSDPPLPLGRLRARGRLSEVRAADLRFSRAEAAALLNDVLGLRLNRHDVTRLWRRTEGWAAGLYLAGLSLRGRSDASAFVAAFAGDDRHLVDYLGAEVLAGQPDDVREFLLRTSILDRLTGPLCDAVTGRRGSDRMLASIERSNLFVVPLDTRRESYRYHQLFAELLRHELAIAHPDVVPELHRRAFRWLCERGAVAAAVGHGIAAGEIAAVRELIADHWSDFLQHGQAATVARWVEGLPDDVIADDPRLALAKARTCLYQRRFEDVDRWLEAVERASRSRPPSPSPVASGTVLLRAARLHMRGAVGAASREARRAVELAPGERSPGWAMAQGALGVTLYWCGDAAAEKALADALRVGGQCGDAVAVLAGLGYLAAIHIDRGELDEADALLDRTAALVDDEPRLAEFVPAMSLVGRGRVLARRGRLAKADDALAQGIRLCARRAGLIETSYALLTHAQIRALLGGADAASALLDEACQAMAACPEPGPVLERLLADVESSLRRSARARSVPAASDELSERELDVLRLLVGPLSLREIGAALYVSLNTVKTHSRAIYRKLGASSRADAVARARELGLLPGGPGADRVASFSGRQTEGSSRDVFHRLR